MKRIKKIVYATDFSSASGRAFTSALTLAKSLNAQLTIVHVMIGLIPIVPEQYFDAGIYDRIERQTREWSQRRLASASERARKSGVKVSTVLREGDAAPQIVQAAKRARADLIVLGTHGRGAIPRFFLGSVAERVVRTSPCPVMTVRGR